MDPAIRECVSNGTESPSPTRLQRDEAEQEHLRVYLCLSNEVVGILGGRTSPLTISPIQLGLPAPVVHPSAFFSSITFELRTWQGTSKGKALPEGQIQTTLDLGCVIWLVRVGLGAQRSRDNLNMYSTSSPKFTPWAGCPNRG